METGEEIDDDDVLPSAWLEENDLKWVDDNNKVHKVPREKELKDMTDERIDRETSTRKDVFSDSGSIGRGNVARLATMKVSPGKTISVQTLTLMPIEGGGVPVGVGMIVAELTGDSQGNYIRTIVDGDGSRDYLEAEMGGQLAYENSDNDTQKIMIGVDNGHYLSGTDDPVIMQAEVRVVAE